MTGRFVAVVGPDGVGKSTLAAALGDAYPGPVGYIHFRPPMRGRLDARPDLSAPPRPKPTGRSNRAAGWLRLARSFVLFWAGYIATIRPAMRRGTLVIADRWCYGYLLQPHAVRFAGPTWLARLVVRAMPAPDLVAALHAPAEMVRDRKPELPAAAVRRELAAIDAIPHRPVVPMDATRPPEEIAAAVLEQLGVR